MKFLSIGRHLCTRASTIFVIGSMKGILSWRYLIFWGANLGGELFFAARDNVTPSNRTWTFRRNLVPSKHR